MTDKTFDVVGIGNAIVDIVAHCQDDTLNQLGITKGAMQLIDAGDIDRFYNKLGPAIEISGGSAANTMVGISSLGGDAAFMGKVRDDEFGRIFRHDIRAASVTFDTPPAVSGAPTARSLIFVTPDGERTMNTFLGISPELGTDEIDAATIAAARIVYLEGYLFDRDSAKLAFTTAANAARTNGCKVALSLSDGFCVERHRDEFLDLVEHHIDILFANEQEICTLFKVPVMTDAIAALGESVEIAALTHGIDGSIICTNGEQISVPAISVPNVIDTTGAGDLFAAGFLYGLVHELDLHRSAELGGLAAAEIIGHLGARPKTALRQYANNNGFDL